MGSVLDHPDLPKIGDSYKKAVTTVILENQEKAMKEERGMLTEAAVNDAAAMLTQVVLQNSTQS